LERASCCWKGHTNMCRRAKGRVALGSSKKESIFLKKVIRKHSSLAKAIY